MGEGDTRNEAAGIATNVIQAREISGGVHIHHHGNTITVIPRQLPRDIAHFTDRTPQLSWLDTWLDPASDHAALVHVIAGAGGVGKTSLAAHWAHRVRGQFPDGDLYLDLRGYHTERSVTPDEALDQLLRALDVPGERIPATCDAKAALYRSLLHGRRMLLLFDNAATAEQIRPLLPGSPTCRVLVTSRSTMSGLIAREGAKRMPLDVLPMDQAIELLRKIGGADRVDCNPTAAAALARHCCCLPLALRIAAERLAGSPYLTVADLVDELAEESDRLDALSVDGDDLATVRAVFSWSYRTLSPETARMFRLLSLPGGVDISATAAAVLCGTTEAKGRRLLEQLVGAHLLIEHQPQRYRFHDLVRVYAAECAQSEERTEARQSATRRLFTWYTHTVLAAARIYAPGFTRIPMALEQSPSGPPSFSDRLAALHWCDTERENLMAAVQTSSDLREHALAWQLPVALFGYFLVRKPLTDWVRSHGIGIAAAKICGERLAEAWLLSSRALAERDLRQYDAAREDFEAALALWRAIGERWGEAWTVRDLGALYRLLGRGPEAVDALERALAMHIEEGDSWGEATASALLAMALHDVGSSQKALQMLDQCLAIRQEQNDQRNIARAMNDLGLVYGALGSTDKAIDYLERALPIHQSFDYWYGEAVARERLGNLLARMGQTAAAEEHWSAAVDLYDRLGDPIADDIRARLP